jgi:TldD protein
MSASSSRRASTRRALIWFSRSPCSAVNPFPWLLRTNSYLFRREGASGPPGYIGAAWMHKGTNHSPPALRPYPAAMWDEAVIRTALDEALASGGELAEIFVEDRSSSALRLEGSRVEDVASGSDAGAGIRVISGERSSYAYTNVMTEAGLRDAARAARAGVSSGSPGRSADLRSVRSETVNAVRMRPEEVDAADKVAALRAADDSARETATSHAGVTVQVVASYMDLRQRVLIASSDGRWAEDDRTRVRFAVQVIASRDGRIMTGFEAPGHSGGFELLEDKPAGELGAKAAAKAIRLLDARPSPAGELPVVLAPGTGGVLIHEACGHGLEADTLVKNASVYANRQGERFGKDIVTIVDDGSDPGAWGSYGVDDEGTPSQRTVLFDQGVLVGHLSDLRSAKKIGHPPTGNGRRQSYAHLPIVRMSNTYLLPGPDDPQQIVSSVKRGVYAASLGGGEVNPATGNFVFGLAEAYMIENGEITHPIRGANLIGNGPRVLSVIDAVAADFDRKEGVCGKDGQHAPVTNGMSTVLLGLMTVGGTET